MNWDDVVAIRKARELAHPENTSDEPSPANAGGGFNVPNLDQTEQMIFRMRAELIDYIQAHGLVDGLVFDGVLQQTQEGKVVITAEMVDVVCQKLGYWKKDNVLDLLGVYLPENHYVQDENYVHTDNNFTDQQVEELAKALLDIAEIKKHEEECDEENEKRFDEIEDDIHDLRDQVDGNSNSIAKLTSSCQLISDKVDGLETVVGDHGRIIDEHTSQIAALTASSVLFSGEIARIKDWQAEADRITQKQNEDIADLKTRNETNEKNIAALIVSDVDINQHLRQIDREHQIITASYIRMEGDIHKLSDVVNEHYQKNEEEHDQIWEAIRTEQEERQGADSELKTGLENVSNEVTKINEEISDLPDLREQVGENKEDIETLKTREGEISNDIEIIENELSKLPAKFSSISSQLITMSSQILNLSSQIKNITASSLGIDKKIDDINTALESLESRVETNEDSISGMATIIQDHAARIADLEKKARSEVSVICEEYSDGTYAIVQTRPGHDYSVIMLAKMKIGEEELTVSMAGMVHMYESGLIGSLVGSFLTEKGSGAVTFRYVNENVGISAIFEGYNGSFEPVGFLIIKQIESLSVNKISYMFNEELSDPVNHGYMYLLEIDAKIGGFPVTGSAMVQSGDYTIALISTSKDDSGVMGVAEVSITYGETSCTGKIEAFTSNENTEIVILGINVIEKFSTARTVTAPIDHYNMEPALAGMGLAFYEVLLVLNYSGTDTRTGIRFTNEVSLTGLIRGEQKPNSNDYYFHGVVYSERYKSGRVGVLNELVQIFANENNETEGLVVLTLEDFIEDIAINTIACARAQTSQFTIATKQAFNKVFSDYGSYDWLNNAPVGSYFFISGTYDMKLDSNNYGGITAIKNLPLVGTLLKRSDSTYIINTNMQPGAVNIVKNVSREVDFQDLPEEDFGVSGGKERYLVQGQSLVNGLFGVESFSFSNPANLMYAIFSGTNNNVLLNLSLDVTSFAITYYIQIK